MPEDTTHPPLEGIARELLRLTRAGTIQWRKVKPTEGGRHPMQPPFVAGYEYVGKSGRVVLGPQVGGVQMGMGGQQSISLLDADGDIIETAQTSAQACMPDPRAPGGMRHVMVPYGYSDEFANVVEELTTLARDSAMRPEQVATGLIEELKAL